MPENTKNIINIIVGSVGILCGSGIIYRLFSYFIMNYFIENGKKHEQHEKDIRELFQSRDQDRKEFVELRTEFKGVEKDHNGNH